jgi:hypothetical protein
MPLSEYLDSFNTNYAISEMLKLFSKELSVSKNKIL